ncbi:hypothetical protein TrST_g4303 [Triparma strigata]|uniref:Uncharacterized protein n=1 Tax=Triparma strigata TaxID=1606541 RepID=A0A9W7AR80_9STRA|nr:hypothetical protein TrST_g4303 [Triparma strigata]
MSSRPSRTKKRPAKYDTNIDSDEEKAIEKAKPLPPPQSSQDGGDLGGDLVEVDEESIVSSVNTAAPASKAAANYSCPCSSHPQTPKVSCICCGYSTCINCVGEILSYCPSCDSWVCNDLEGHNAASRSQMKMYTPEGMKMYTSERIKSFIHNDGFGQDYTLSCSCGADSREGMTYGRFCDCKCGPRDLEWVKDGTYNNDGLNFKIGKSKITG